MASFANCFFLSAASSLIPNSLVSGGHGDSSLQLTHLWGFNSSSQGGASPPPSDILNPIEEPKVSWISFSIRQDRHSEMSLYKHAQVTMTHRFRGSGMSLLATWPPWVGLT